MRTLVLLVVWAVVSGCQGLPKFPEGKPICNHFAEDAVAVCNEIGTGKEMPEVPVAITDGWFMLPPDSVEAVMNYIDALERRVKARLGDSAPELNDLHRIKAHLRHVLNELKYRNINQL